MVRVHNALFSSITCALEVIPVPPSPPLPLLCDRPLQGCQLILERHPIFLREDDHRRLHPEVAVEVVGDDPVELGDDLLRRLPGRGDDAPDVMYEADPGLAQADFSAQWRESLADEFSTRPEPDADTLGLVRSLPAGTWIEFRAMQAGEFEMERGKLCWTSPYTGHGLFVNRNGVRLRESSPEALAMDLQAGRALVIDDSRLLERTLRSLVDEVQHAVELPARMGEG